MLVGLLQAEGGSGESVAGEGPRGRRVHRVGGQRVSRRRRAVHWRCSTGLEQEVPAQPLRGLGWGCGK